MGERGRGAGGQAGSSASSAYSVRGARESDAEVLARIKRTEEDQAYSGYGSAEEHATGLANFCSRAYVDRLIRQRRGGMLVAESATRIVGMVAYRIEPHHVWLHALYVSDKGQGVGRRLVDEVTSVGRGEGHVVVRCETFAVNHAAAGALQAFGFRRTGSVRPSRTYSDQILIEFEAPIGQAERPSSV